MPHEVEISIHLCGASHILLGVLLWGFVLCIGIRTAQPMIIWQSPRELGEQNTPLASPKCGLVVPWHSLLVTLL